VQRLAPGRPPDLCDGASAALHGLSIVSTMDKPRALHPLPLPANAAHVNYSDRLLGPSTHSAHADVLQFGVVQYPVLRTFAPGSGLLDSAERRNFGGDDSRVQTHDAVFDGL